LTLSGVVIGASSGALTVVVCLFGMRSIAFIDEYLWSITEARKYSRKYQAMRTVA
jgi:hypothetical protein